MNERKSLAQVRLLLADFPAVALLGPRQCGKTTLAKMLAAQAPASLYLDLERPSDVARLSDAELFLSRNADRLVMLDEIQRVPELFPVLRALIDEDRRAGRFLLLGSASPDLLHQTSESLAGRIAFHELAPFHLREVTLGSPGVQGFWLRGGYPLSWLARSDAASFDWREAFITTHLERDIPGFGIRVPGTSLRRFWQMVAHLHGQLWNASRLAAALGVSAPTAQHYLGILEATFMLRRLLPWSGNGSKRLVKSPKIYLRDSGLLHALLGLPTLDALLGHPICGASFEGWALEQLIQLLGPSWQFSFYRTAAGAELDVLAERGNERVGFEVKLSTAPAVTKGFWSALDDLQVQRAYVIAPVASAYPLNARVEVWPAHLLGDLPEAQRRTA